MSESLKNLILANLQLKLKSIDASWKQFKCNEEWRKNGYLLSGPLFDECTKLSEESSKCKTKSNDASGKVYATLNFLEESHITIPEFVKKPSKISLDLLHFSTELHRVVVEIFTKIIIHLFDWQRSMRSLLSKKIQKLVHLLLRNKNTFCGKQSMKAIEPNRVEHRNNDNCNRT